MDHTHTLTEGWDIRKARESFIIASIPLWAGILLLCVAPSLAAEFQVMDRLAVSGSAVFSGTVTVVSGITAASGTFTSSGAAQYSVETASGIKVNAGGVVAPFFLGNGSGLTEITANDPLRVSKSGDGMTGPLTLNNSTLTVTGDAFSVGGTTLVVRGGLVGVGTSAMLAPLHVLSGAAGSSSGQAALIVSGTSDGAVAGSGPYIRFDNGASNLEIARIGSVGEGAGNAGMAFSTLSSNATAERVRIAASGNVGIGITNPAYPLDVVASEVRIQHPSMGAWVRVKPGNAGAEEWESGANNLGWSVFSLTDGAYRFTVNNDGNVGIGTSGPVDKLEIAGGGIRLTRPNGITWNGTNEKIYVSDGSDGQAGSLVLKSGGVIGLLVKPDGAVGIGTTNPGSVLTVRGPVGGTLALEDTTGSQIWDIASNNGHLYFQYKNTSDAKFRFQYDGAAYAESGPWSTGAVDFAEFFEQQSIGELQTADIVCLAGARKVRKCGDGENPIGVVSASPGFVGGQGKTDRRGDPAYALVGLTGQLPVRATRDVKTGEALAPSGNARIIAMEDGRAGGLVWALVR